MAALEPCTMEQLQLVMGHVLIQNEQVGVVCDTLERETNQKVKAAESNVQGVVQGMEARLQQEMQALQQSLHVRIVELELRNGKLEHELEQKGQQLAEVVSTLANLRAETDARQKQVLASQKFASSEELRTAIRYLKGQTPKDRPMVQDHPDHGNIGDWDVSGLKDFSCLFDNVILGAHDLSRWDISSATNMNHMFKDSSINRDLGISDWGPLLSNLVSCEGMFQNCKEAGRLNLPWGTLPALEVTTSMFLGCASFKGTGLETWRTPRLVVCNKMFCGCTELDVESLHFDMSHVFNAQCMFQDCTKFNAALPNWVLRCHPKTVQFTSHRNTDAVAWVQPFEDSDVWYLDANRQQCFGPSYAEKGDLTGDLTERACALTFAKIQQSSTGLRNGSIRHSLNVGYMFRNCKSFEGKGLATWTLGTGINGCSTNRPAVFAEQLKFGFWYNDMLAHCDKVAGDPKVVEQGRALVAVADGHLPVHVGYCINDFYFRPDRLS